MYDALCVHCDCVCCVCVVCVCISSLCGVCVHVVWCVCGVYRVCLGCM